MDSILPDRRVVPCFRSKHICRAVSLRARQLDVDLIRLLFSLATDQQPMDCILRRRVARPFGSIFTLRQAMSLLRAQHASHRLAVLELFQNEIGAGLYAVPSRIGFSLSHPPIRDRAGNRARWLESGLPAGCDAASLDLVCRARNCVFNLALARAFIAVLQRICAEHNRRAIAW